MECRNRSFRFFKNGEISGSDKLCNVVIYCQSLHNDIVTNEEIVEKSYEIALRKSRRNMRFAI